MEVIPINEDTASPAELVAQFTGEELNRAAHETSKQYNGIVLKFATHRVLFEKRLSRQELAHLMGTSKSSMTRYSQGMPLASDILDQVLFRLAMVRHGYDLRF